MQRLAILCVILCAVSSELTFMLVGSSFNESGLNRRFREGLFSAFAQMCPVTTCAARILTLEQNGDPNFALRMLTNVSASDTTAIILAPHLLVSRKDIISSITTVLRIPIISSWAGLRSFFEPFNKYNINLDPSLDDEVEETVKRMVERFVMKISIIIEPTVVGAAANSSLVLALAKWRLLPFSTAVFDSRATNGSFFGDLPVTKTASEATSYLLGSSPWNFPQAVLICHSATNDTAQLASAVLANYPTWTRVQVYVVSCNTDVDAVAASPLLSTAARESAIFTQSYPPVGTFQAQHSRGLNATFPLSSAPSVASTRGYAIGALLSASMKRISSLADDNSFATGGELLLRSIYETSVFTISDIRLGPYGLPCEVSSGWEGCGCNSGARAIHFLKVAAAASAYPFKFAAEDPSHFIQRCLTPSTLPPADALPIIIGQSAPMFAAYSGQGLALYEGLLAACKRHNDAVNRAGGGKKVFAVLHNDYYTASNHVANVLRMLNRDKVDLMAANFGSPTNTATASIFASTVTNPLRIPNVNPFTGVEILRINQPLVLNIRAGYADEATSHLAWLKKRGITRIGLLAVNSAFGLSGRSGVIEGLKYLRMSPVVADVIHEAVAFNVTLGFSQLMEQAQGVPPQALILFVVQNFAPPFLQMCIDHRFPESTIYFAPFSMISPAIPMAVRPKLFFSSVMPDTNDLSSPVMQSFATDRARMPPEWKLEPDNGDTFEGYVVGRVLIDMLTFSNMDSTKVVDTFYKIQTFSIDGLPLGPFSHPCAPGEYDAIGYQCGCTTGLRSVWYSKYDPSSNYTDLKNFDTNFTLNACGMVAVNHKPPCLSGQQTVYVSSETMEFDCPLCPKGSSNNVTGSTVCAACPIGWISSEAGAVTCTACPPGSFQDRSGQSQCFPCGENSYQDASGAASCHSCPSDKVFAGIGATSSSQCVPRRCTAGEQKIDTACVSCDPGTYFNNHTEKCSKCPLGEFSASAKSLSCEACPAGSKAPLLGMAQCLPCSISEFQDDTGSSSCSSCPANSVTCKWTAAANSTSRSLGLGNATALLPSLTCSSGSTSRSSCFCSPDYYTTDSEIPCATCPEGAHCCMCPEIAACAVNENDVELGLGECNLDVLLENLRVLHAPCSRCDTGSLKPITRRGYFNTSFLFEKPSSWHILIPCDPPEACLGGPQNNCEVGYVGLRCGLCQKGFYQSSDQTCLQCPETTGLRIITTIAVALTPIVLGTMFLYNAESMFRASSMTIAIDWLQTLSIIATFQVPWPSSMRVLYAISSLINFKISILPLGCIFRSEWDFYSSWGLQFSLPFILCGYCVFLWFLIRTFVRLKIIKSTRFSKQSTLINTVCVCLTISYTSVTKNTFSFLRCYNFGMVSFLADTPYVQCFSSKWYTFLPLCVTFAIIYCGGVPAAVFLVLRRLGQRRSETFYKRSFGSIYAIFTTTSWFWNSILLVRKLLIIMALSLFPNSPMIQMVLTVCIFSAFILLNNKFSPFAFQPSNNLMFWCVIQTAIATLSGILFLYDQKSPTLDQNQKIMVSVLVWLTFIWSLLLCAQGIASEMVGYRLFYRADDTTWIQKLFNSNFGRRFLFTRSQHWAIAQEMRERFQLLDDVDRLAVFKHDPSPLKEILGSDRIHQMPTSEIMQLAFRAELSPHAVAYLEAHPEQNQEFGKMLRTLLDYKRSSTINQIYSSRSDRIAIQSGLPPSPFSRTPTFRLRRSPWSHSFMESEIPEPNEVDDQSIIAAAVCTVLNAPSAIIDVPLSFDLFEGSGLGAEWILNGSVDGEDEVC